MRCNGRNAAVALPEIPRASDPLPFLTRSDMLNHCYKVHQRFKHIKYYDTVSHQKWASTFLLGVAYHQMGETNLWRMLEVEAMQLLRLLEVQHISSYVGLDAVEVQLRKKAFWLMFCGYVHHMQSLRNERLTFLDAMILRGINLEDLMPAAIDDDYITTSGILPYTESTSAASITAGFNTHVHVFWAGLGRPQSECLGCSHAKAPSIRLASRRERLRHLTYMLDTVLPVYSIWGPKNSDDDNQVGNTQREVVRANIHMTHLWLQSALLDQIDAIKNEREPTLLDNSEVLPDLASWDKRENICRQMLHSLHSFSPPVLEANGLAIVYKIRDVAASLLACPADASEERRRRAKEYLREFCRFLSVLDVSETVNTVSLQIWVNVSPYKVTSPTMSQS